MSDNARFHNKLHRRNHHTDPSPGYPDSGTDPIASPAEPFRGTFVVNGDISASGSITSLYYTLSNISIEQPILSANVGFQPTSSLIIQLSGVKYAVPITLVGDNTFNGSTSGVNSLSSGITYLGNTFIVGTLSGDDSDRWNSAYTILSATSASWKNGYIAFTSLTANSGNWSSTYTSVCANSGSWVRATVSDTWVRANSATINAEFNTSSFAKLSSQSYTFQLATSSINTEYVPLNNTSSGYYSSVLGGSKNIASGFASLVLGGESNCAAAEYTAVLGGCCNYASGSASVIGGGIQNIIGGDYSTIIGGRLNRVNTGITNIVIAGSNIDAYQSDFTYVNNLSSQNLIVGVSGFMDFIEVSPENAGGETLPNTRAQFFSNINSYSQINHQNVSSGELASTDFIATADNGTDSTNYVNLGINSSTYSLSAYGITGTNDAYLYSQSTNLAIGTIGANSSLIFHTSGAKTIDERMRITPAGNVGIGTSTPEYKLTVIGDISATGKICSSNAIFTNINTSVRPAIGSNTSSGLYSFIANGLQNVASEDYSYTGTGSGHFASGKYSAIINGISNTSSGVYGTIINGSCNTAAGSGSFIGTGTRNCILGQSDYSAIVSGQDNIINSSIGGFIGAGSNNCINGHGSVIIGGSNNISRGCNTVIAGNNNCIISGVTNTYVFGSCIQASQSSATYVNNLISLSSVCAVEYNGDGANLTSVTKPYEVPYRVIPEVSAIVPLSGSNYGFSQYSFIAGGTGNDTRGLSGTFILGTSLSAVSANYTYVNNISSQGTIAGNILIGQNLYIGSTEVGTVTGLSTSKFPVYTKEGIFIGYVPIYS